MTVGDREWAGSGQGVGVEAPCQPVPRRSRAAHPLCASLNIQTSNPPLQVAPLVIMAAHARVEARLAGLALTQSLQLAGMLQWMVRQSAEVENQMVRRLFFALVSSHMPAHCRMWWRRLGRKPLPPCVPLAHRCACLPWPTRPPLASDHPCSFSLPPSTPSSPQTSVERMLHYTGLEQEPPTLAQGGQPPPKGASAPLSGRVPCAVPGRWRAVRAPD